MYQSMASSILLYYPSCCYRHAKYQTQLHLSFHLTLKNLMQMVYAYVLHTSSYAKDQAKSFGQYWYHLNDARNLERKLSHILNGNCNTSKL